MRIRNVHFLAKANNKGNKKSTTVLISMIILIISLSVISSFSNSIQKNVNTYKNDYAARMFYITPDDHPLDNKTIESVSKIKYVEGVFPQIGFRDTGFEWLKVSDAPDVQKQINNSEAYLCFWSLVGNEKKDVVYGKTLEESPAYSCLVPDRFYPFDLPEGVSELNGSLEYMDGKELVGKTLTLHTDAYSVWYTENAGAGEIPHDLNEMTIEIYVAGVYHLTPTSRGGDSMLLVSEETAALIEEKAINDYFKGTPKWRKDLSLRDYYVVVEDYDKLDYVRNTLTEMGIDFADYSEVGMSDTVFMISNLLSVISLLLALSTVILNIVNIMQSSVNSLMDRKGEIGLMKAIGYKNKQIFLTMYYEQSVITLKGAIIGGLISSVIVFVINIFNEKASLINRLYIINWGDFLIYLAIAFSIAIVVPLICQLICLKKLNKIQPKDAMNS